MRKLVYYVLAVILTVTCLSSCSKEDFAYPMSDVYGTWDGIAVKLDGKWIDITDKYYYDDFQFSITFYEDGKYYGKGFFGTGSGTYKADGNVIYTYVGGKSYMNYRVVSLKNNVAELQMFVEGDPDTIDIRAKKR